MVVDSAGSLRLMKRLRSAQNLRQVALTQRGRLPATHQQRTAKYPESSLRAAAVRACAGHT